MHTISQLHLASQEGGKSTMLRSLTFTVTSLMPSYENLANWHCAYCKANLRCKLGNFRWKFWWVSLFGILFNLQKYNHKLNRRKNRGRVNFLRLTEIAVTTRPLKTNSSVIYLSQIFSSLELYVRSRQRLAIPHSILYLLCCLHNKKIKNYYKN